MKVCILPERPRGKPTEACFAAAKEKAGKDAYLNIAEMEITLSREQAEAVCKWLESVLYGVTIRRITD